MRHWFLLPVLICSDIQLTWSIVERPGEHTETQMEVFLSDSQLQRCHTLMQKRKLLFSVKNKLVNVAVVAQFFVFMNNCWIWKVLVLNIICGWTSGVNRSHWWWTLQEREEVVIDPKFFMFCYTPPKKKKLEKYFLKKKSRINTFALGSRNTVTSTSSNSGL